VKPHRFASTVRVGLHALAFLGGGLAAFSAAPIAPRETIALFKDYNSVGITTISDRNAGLGAIEGYAKLRDAGRLTVRVRASQGVGSPN